MDNYPPDLSEQIAKRLNASIDLPLLSERVEGELLLFIVSLTTEHASPEIRQFLFDASDGLTPAECRLWTQTICERVADAVDIPFVPESFEKLAMQHLFSAIVEYVKNDLVQRIVSDYLQFALKGNSLPE